MTIREETPDDVEAIRDVNRLAFGGDEEVRLVDALRAGGFVLVSLIATEAGSVIGHILFSKMGTGTIFLAALAPVAVLPDHQRRGIGSALIRRGLDLCRDRGCEAVLVVGHPEYYPRFGFSANLASPLRAPFSGPAFMALELVPGALARLAGAAVRYAPPFGID